MYKTVIYNLEYSSQQHFSAHLSRTHGHIFSHLHQSKTSIIDIAKRNPLICFKGHSVISVNPLQTTQGNVRSDRLCDTNVRHGLDMELCQVLKCGERIIHSAKRRLAHSYTQNQMCTRTNRQTQMTQKAGPRILFIYRSKQHIYTVSGSMITLKY